MPREAVTRRRRPRASSAARRPVEARGERRPSWTCSHLLTLVDHSSAVTCVPQEIHPAHRHPLRRGPRPSSSSFNNPVPSSLSTTTVSSPPRPQSRRKGAQRRQYALACPATVVFRRPQQASLASQHPHRALCSPASARRPGQPEREPVPLVPPASRHRLAEAPAAAAWQPARTQQVYRGRGRGDERGRRDWWAAAHRLLRRRR